MPGTVILHMPEIRLRYDWDLPEIYLRYALPEIPETSLRYLFNSFNVSTKCTRIR